VKAYKERPTVRKISVKCQHEFIIPVRFVAVIASQNLFSAMHSVYSLQMHSECLQMDRDTVPCLERHGMRFLCPACATTDVCGKIAEKFAKLCLSPKRLSPKRLVAQHVAQVSVT